MLFEELARNYNVRGYSLILICILPYLPTNNCLIFSATLSAGGCSLKISRNFSRASGYTSIQPRTPSKMADTWLYLGIPIAVTFSSVYLLIIFCEKSDHDSGLGSTMAL